MSRTPGKVLFFAVAFLSSLSLRATQPLELFELPVWSGAAPGSESATAQETWEERGKGGVVDRAVRQVHRPTITVYLPESAHATGIAVILAPGGGYEHVTIDKEGHDVARWLIDHGIAGIVLKYRLPRTPGSDYTPQTALADVAEALKRVREHAGEWRIAPNKVGLMGFSAGGNLAALAGTKLPVDVRPSFLGLMYPSIPESLGPVLADTPPAFIAQAVDDPMGTEHSVRIYQWIHAQRVPVEMHLFSSGAHGFGLGKPGTPPAAWPELFVHWLGATGFLKAK